MFRTLSFILVFVSSFANAGEGHVWMDLKYEAKASMIHTYEYGLMYGCIKGVDISAKTLFIDSDIQMKQSFKLMKECPAIRITTAPEMSKVIKIIDDTYSMAGTSDIPVISMIDESLKSYNLGEMKIKEDTLKKLIKTSLL